MRQILLSACLLHRWTHCGTEKLRNLLEVTQLVRGKAGMGIRVFWLGSLSHNHSTTLSFSFKVSRSSLQLGTHVCFLKHSSFSIISLESLGATLRKRKAHLSDGKTEGQRDCPGSQHTRDRFHHKRKQEGKEMPCPQCNVLTRPYHVSPAPFKLPRKKKSYPKAPLGLFIFLPPTCLPLSSLLPLSPSSS